MIISTILAPLFFFNLFTYVPWTLVFLVTPFLGIRLYHIKTPEECTRIQKRLNTYSHITDNGKGYGYSCGYWYILHISSDSNDRDCITMIATTESYKMLSEELKEEQSLFEQGWKPPPISDQSKISVFERSGKYSNPWFRRRERDAKDIPRGQQKEIVSVIIDDYMKRRHTVVYIHGNPGTGKSMVGILVANEFSSYFCNTLKPWQPGDTIGILLTEVEPTPQKPLILVFDEIDLTLTRIHKGIPPHKECPISVSDKSGWNHMLDSIQRGMYPNLILILTSNRSPEFIEELDPSYIRKGRVDLIFEMNESLL